MGLVGRLEDLPVSDIVEIVYLSRGTGVLELKLPRGRHTVMFKKGVMVNASSPLLPELRADLEQHLNAGPLNRLVNPALPAGLAAMQKHLVTPRDLGKIIFQRVANVVRALCEMRSGTFEFVSREPSLDEMEYEPTDVFKRGGIRPEDILGKRGAGLQTLGNVKQSLEAGVSRSANIPIPAHNTNPAPAVRMPDRCIALFESEATTRDAIKRASGIRGLATVEVRSAANVDALLERGTFFVAVISLGADPEEVAFPLVRVIKRNNAHLPVVVLDGTSDFRRRHLALEAGADVYMRKPAANADEERAVFAEDLMLYVERRIAERPPAAGAGAEPMHRGFRLLVQLLKEVSDPGDMSQMSLTILQLAADYVDRGVLFAIKGNQMITLGKFGVRSNGSALNLQRGDLSILDRVIETRRSFRGAVSGAAAGELESAFGAVTVGEAIALPMLSGDDVVGVFYGDNAIHQKPIDETVGLEVFLSQAGFAFQNLLMESAAARAAAPLG